jgi:hypothetical protein
VGLKPVQFSLCKFSGRHLNGRKAAGYPFELLRQCHGRFPSFKISNRSRLALMVQ